MSITPINIGAVQNDGTGDPLRDAFGKVNENFAELEGSVGSVSAANAAALRDRATHTGQQAIGTVAGLQSALDAKANTSHTHAIANVTGLQAALDAKANTSHTHAIANVTGLQAALDAKANTSHTHAIANVTGLQAALDGTVKTSGVQNISGSLFMQSQTEEKQVGWVFSDRIVYLYGQPNSAGVGMYDSVGGVRFATDKFNNFTVAGNITAYSDIRLKTDITKITDALSKVSRLNGYTYTRKDTGARQTGVVAQEVQEVLPEAVINNGKHLAVAYGNMVGLLIEAIKELKAEVDQLKGK